MLKHTCTVRVAADGGDDLYRHPQLSWSDEATGQACLWQERPHGVVDRSKDTWAKRLDYDGILYMVYDLDLDETRRITAVKDKDSNVLEAGPLRVVWSENAGGQEHHLELYCKRSTVKEIA